MCRRQELEQISTPSAHDNLGLLKKSFECLLVHCSDKMFMDSVDALSSLCRFLIP